MDQLSEWGGTDHPFRHTEDRDRLIGRLDAMEKAKQESDRLYFKERFNAEISELSANIEYVKSYLSHSDARYRYAVLSFLENYAKHHVDNEDVFTKYAREDPAPDVRLISILGLGRLFGESGRKDLARLLLDIAFDENEEFNNRKYAYLGILSPEEFLRFSMDDAEFCFPQDVDWQLVATLLHDI